MTKKIYKNSDFLLLCTGGFISNIGDHLYNLAITIFLYSITNSITSIAVMWIFRGILRIPVQFLSGIIADKYNKKLVITLTNLISVPIAFLFIFVNENNIWLSYILAFLLQSINDIDVCSENAILPKLVEKEDLSYANSIFSFLSSVTIFLSPAIGGLIYKFKGTEFLFIINAVSFLIASSLFSFIKYKHEKIDNNSSELSIIQSGKEGLKIVSKYSSVKIIFLIASMYAIMGRFYETFKIAVSDQLLNLNPEGIIYFNYALAIGGLLVPLFVKFLSNYSKIKLYIFSILIISLGYLIFGYSNSRIITFSTLIILGIFSSLNGVYCTTILQETIPSEYIGRVFSFYKILLTFFALLGLAISPTFYNLIGIGNSFLIISVIIIVLCGKCIYSKNVKVESSSF